MTMTLVSTVTVGSGGAASIDFTSIPQTGTDLLVIYSLRDSNGGTGMNAVIRFNSDSGSNYTTRWLLGSGSVASSSTIAGSSQIYAGKYAGGGDTASTFGSLQVYIPNYTGSTAKSVSSEGVEENNGTASFQTLSAGIWTGTSAITSITVNATSGFVQYSTASLYTITKGSGGASTSTTS